jgi:two-component system sensor histidine kinase YesM
MIYVDKKLVSEISPKYLGRVINYFAGINLSIRAKMLWAFMVVILLMGLVNAVMIAQVLRYNREYDAIINNIIAANSLNGYINPAIDTEMWNIVAGKKEFNEGNQYEILASAREHVYWMLNNSDSEKSKIKLEVLLRTIRTITHYVDIMGAQMAQGSRVAENEKVLENIWGVSDIFETSVQDYILFEVGQAQQKYSETQSRVIRWAVTYMALPLLGIVFSMMAAWVISESIYIPIKKLHSVTTTITKNDLQVLVSGDNANEIAELGMSFNIMIAKIREMLDAEIREQEELKKSEFRALQAQINPHFLYNTLDTIVWMAEAKKTDDVVDIVRALSSFFRITLSKGKDWITIREEVEHTRSYLTIQKMRYRDILDYRIEVDEQVQDSTILKLIIQPLVENALYHGIKNKRSGGAILVRVQQQDPASILLQVEDNGIGYTPERWAAVEAELQDNSGAMRIKESGFGLDNVNKRVKLYYGKQYGLSIDTAYGQGTRVSLVIPFKTD